MSLYTLFYKLLPFLFPLVLGYGLARWMGLTAKTLMPLVSYVCLPLILFSAVAGRLSIDEFLKLVLAGSLTALAGHLLYMFGNKLLKVQMGTSVNLPNVGFFTLPFLFLVLGGTGIGSASAFFVGVLTTIFIIQQVKQRDFKAIFKEPWLYASLLGVVFILTSLKVPLLQQTIGPVVEASYVLLLIFLGSYLFPFTGYKDPEAYVTVFFRLTSGFLVALLAIKILSLPSVIAKAVMISALAPPIVSNLLFNVGSDRVDEAATKIGVLVSTILMGAILFAGWKPWAI